MSSTSPLNAIAFWLGLVASVAGVVALIDQGPLLSAVTLLLGVATVIAWSFAIRARRAVRTQQTLAALSIHDVPMDSLALSEIRKLTNEDIEVHEVDHRALVQDNDLRLAIRIRARCIRRDGTDAVDFSIHGESGHNVAPVDCFGFDHQNDPAHALRIEPRPKETASGIARHVTLPLLKHAAEGDAVDVELFAHWPGCMRWGRDYFSAALRFAHQRLRRYVVELSFSDPAPQAVWVFRLSEDGRFSGEGSVPFVGDEGRAVFRDIVNPKEVDQHSTRVYIFDRPERRLSERGTEMRKTARSGGGGGGGGISY